MGQINWILFDLGNVLYDIAVEEVFTQLLSGITVNSSNLKELGAFHKEFMAGKYDEKEFLRELKEKVNFPGNIDELRKIWNEIIVSFREEFRPLLTKLKANYRTGLLSNTDKIHYRKVLRQVPDFERFFAKIFLSYRIKEVKPSEKIFARVLEELNVQPHTVIFFDDSQENVKVAESLGIKGFWADNYQSVLTILRDHHIL